MSTHPIRTKGSDVTGTADTNERSLSRRGFLGVGGAAAAAAVGAAVLEPILPGGSVARALPEPPPLPSDRLDAAYQRRLAAAERMRDEGMSVAVANGDEELYSSFIGNYSKGLPHGAIGEVDPTAYLALLDALASGDPADFEQIPMAGVRKLVNPQAGIAFDTHGNDPQQFAQPPAPALASAEAAGEMVELYWMALLRDVRYSAYANHPLARRAAEELSSLSDFRGPRSGGEVTPATLFRDDLSGALDGPYVSQFLLKGTPFGAEYVERRMRTPAPGNDHLTSFADWLAVQNGAVPGHQTFDTTRRFIRNGRDLAEWVHIDVLFQAYFNACLILGSPPDPSNQPSGGGIGCPVNPGNPYLGSATQEGFGTWGGPFFKTLVCEVARSLKAVWYQKWFVHRRLRPEAYGGRVHARKKQWASYPIHPDVLHSEGLDRVQRRTGSYLLPMAFPEGSPLHPSYGAGHATVAGACVTILKALFDETFEVPDPVVPNGAGTVLVPYSGPPLTVGGELNKLASNVATGRNQAGVHWRSDAVESLKLGEACAIAILRDHVAACNEIGSFQFTTFDGTPIVIG
jgi:hypothetical protein